MNIMAQVLAITANITLMISNQQTSKAKILLIQVITDILFIAQYMLLNAYSGAIIGLLALFRIVVFYNYERYEKPISKKVLAIFLCISVISWSFTYENLFSILPLFASIIYTYALWQSDLKRYRILESINATSWIVYNSLVGAYVASICSVFEFLSAVYAIIRYDLNKK